METKIIKVKEVPNFFENCNLNNSLTKEFLKKNGFKMREIWDYISYYYEYSNMKIRINYFPKYESFDVKIDNQNGDNFKCITFVELKSLSLRLLKEAIDFCSRLNKDKNSKIFTKKYLKENNFKCTTNGLTNFYTWKHPDDSGLSVQFWISRGRKYKDHLVYIENFNNSRKVDIGINISLQDLNNALKFCRIEKQFTL